MRKTMRQAAMAMALVLGAVFCAGCGSRDSGQEQTTESAGTEASVQESTEGETAQTEAGTGQEEGDAMEEDYDGRLVYDSSMELQYVKGFSVDYYKGGYKLISIIDGTKLLIVPEGMSVPEDTEDDTIVLQQPVENILVSSTPTTSLINAVGALDAISLTTYDMDSWYIDSVKEALENGSMQYIGNYNEPDYEMITASGTDFAIFSAMLTEDVAAQLEQLGVRVMLDRAAEEEHPLARVEWMKLYGAMFNLEEKAEELVNEQIAYVDEIASKEATGKSVAIFYITSKGALYARNADDYMAKMVDLAGGEYILSDVGVGESGTINMEMEAFYDAAKDADYIIYIWSLGGRSETLADFLERSEILADMKAVQEGNVWCTTPDFFQISNTLGSMINDMNLMLNADETTDTLTYLFKLQ